jgi:hypothetical protein
MKDFTREDITAIAMLTLDFVREKTGIDISSRPDWVIDMVLETARQQNHIENQLSARRNIQKLKDHKDILILGENLEEEE